MTDDRMEKSLEQQELFTEVARSRDVEVRTRGGGAGPGGRTRGGGEDQGGEGRTRGEEGGGPGGRTRGEKSLEQQELFTEVARSRDVEPGRGGEDQGGEVRTRGEGEDQGGGGGRTRGEKSLEQQELFTEVARSRDVEVLEGKPIYADCCGNLVPLTKSGQHHLFSFYAFKENRLALFIKVRDSTQEPCGRLSFMREPRNYRALTQNAICNLNISLPSYCKDSDSDQEQENEVNTTN
ncbi:unnamed protein product [Arctogadus glacialis]